MIDLFLSAGEAPSATHWILLILGALFMTLPVLGLVTAVDPTERRPGVGVLINLRTGASSAAGGAVRYLLLGVKNTSTGTGTAEVLYEDMANADAVGTLSGAGSLTHLAAQRLFEEHPTASVDLVMMAAPAGNAAAGTITFDDTTAVTVDQDVTITIAGREIVTVWLAGETDIQAATRAVSKINAATKRLPVTAANGGGTLAAITLTAKSKGKWGLDVAYNCELSGGTGGAVTTAAAALTGGTTEPSATAALALVASREYRLIVPCLSNADLATASPTSANMGLIKTHITGKNTGIGALLQTAHTACTDSTTNAKAMSNQHDTEYFTHHLIRGGQSLPAEWGGAIAGLYGREIRSDANHPFVLAEFKDATELYGSDDIDADGLTAAEAEDLLASGVSYVEYTAQRRPRLARPITCYFEDSDGNPDDRILDVSKVFGMIAVAADLRTEVQRTFKGKKLLRNLPSGRTPIPPNVIEERDAKAFILGRIRSQWVAAGVINGERLDEVIADGSLIVQVDPTDETQLDAYLPLRVIPPLVKTSLVLVQA